MSPGGRRPGNVDTREEIVEAARRVFAEKGYEHTSLRGVAREAGVDAALVHHYFDGKADLFMAAMSIPFDPRAVKKGEVRHIGSDSPGARTVEGFLTMWDNAEGTASSFASCAVAMATSESVALAVREFVSERLWGDEGGPPSDEPDVWRRRSLVSTQLMGLAFTRYIQRMPPIATAAPAEIARWVGPNIDRYISDPDL